MEQTHKLADLVAEFYGLGDAILQALKGIEKELGKANAMTAKLITPVDVNVTVAKPEGPPPIPVTPGNMERLQQMEAIGKILLRYIDANPEGILAMDLQAKACTDMMQADLPTGMLKTTIYALRDQGLIISENAGLPHPQAKAVKWKRVST